MGHKIYNIIYEQPQNIGRAKFCPVDYNSKTQYWPKMFISFYLSLWRQIMMPVFATNPDSATINVFFISIFFTLSILLLFLVFLVFFACFHFSSRFRRLSKLSLIQVGLRLSGDEVLEDQIPGEDIKDILGDCRSINKRNANSSSC